jgi:uncharacterized membrane protein YgcG
MAQEPKKITPARAPESPVTAPLSKNPPATARTTTKPSTKPAPMAPPEQLAGQLVLKVKDLVDRVTEATDGNRGQIKGIVEATLAVLARALDAGETLNLPPIGKIRVAKPVAEGTTGAMTVKVRKGNPPKPKEPKPPKPAKEPKVKEKGAGGKGGGKGAGGNGGGGGKGGGGKGGGKGKQTLAGAED